MVAAVLAAQEERQRTVELAQEEERLRAEIARAKDREVLREAEAEERARLNEGLSRQSAVEAARLLERATFAEEAYTPPVPHLFVPSGFVSYMPQ